MQLTKEECEKSIQLYVDSCDEAVKTIKQVMEVENKTSADCERVRKMSEMIQESSLFMQAYSLRLSNLLKQ